MERAPALPTGTAPIGTSPFFYPSPWNESRRTRNILRVQYAETVHQRGWCCEASARNNTVKMHGHTSILPCARRDFTNLPFSRAVDQPIIMQPGKRQQGWRPLRPLIVPRVHMEPDGPSRPQPDRAADRPARSPPLACFPAPRFDCPFLPSGASRQCLYKKGRSALPPWFKRNQGGVVAILFF